MTRFYLVRTKADFVATYSGNNDEKLHTFNSEDEALDFTVDRMKGVGCRVMDIVKTDFSYGRIQFTEMEVEIDRGKFKFSPIVQDAEQQK